MFKNRELELACEFIEKTNRNVFLTGKAGTGKTTFLHKLKETSFKRLMVVAPTGVAAINAKGVTIHSFFQMPFGPLLPDALEIPKFASGFQRKFNKTKVSIIKSLDLLIIDEISMVRADLLDGIDGVLKRYKDKTRAFGGVQVLMIGDLQQLAPVVKDSEWELLKPHYETPYFFSSLVFKSSNPISIELKYIYRQKNETFIKILNEIRNNRLTDHSESLLNQRYMVHFEPLKQEGYITLTTHNQRANEMNIMELQKIEKQAYFYNAEVEGSFPDYAYPTHETLELKKGAQVMFVKNDSTSDKRYFNGKIGEIIHLENDEILVRCHQDEGDIVVTPELWENINYSIDPDTNKIIEQVTGSFLQMPLRLAWAITIHKSQGLTFEKAIIDAEASFAHGQTYVALSRCKTLEGIVLKHPIKKDRIINDVRVSAFSEMVENNPPNDIVLLESQKSYQLSLIEELFDYHAFLEPINRILDIYNKNPSSIKGHLVDPLTTMKARGIMELLKLKTRFMAQVKALGVDRVEPDKNAAIQNRVHKALIYFETYTINFIKSPFEALTFVTENKEIDKDINKQLDAIEAQLATKLVYLNSLKTGYSSLKYLELRVASILQKSMTKPVKRAQIDTTKHPILFDQLKSLRTSLAHLENVPPYVVFTQKSLFEICEMLPLNQKQLRTVNGMGEVRVKKYGQPILDLVNDYASTSTVEPKAHHG